MFELEGVPLRELRPDVTRRSGLLRTSFGTKLGSLINEGLDLLFNFPQFSPYWVILLLSTEPIDLLDGFFA